MKELRWFPLRELVMEEVHDSTVTTILNNEQYLPGFDWRAFAEPTPQDRPARSHTLVVSALLAAELTKKVHLTYLRLPLVENPPPKAEWVSVRLLAERLTNAPDTLTTTRISRWANRLVKLFNLVGGTHIKKIDNEAYFSQDVTKYLLGRATLDEVYHPIHPFSNGALHSQFFVEVTPKPLELVDVTGARDDPYSDSPFLAPAIPTSKNTPQAKQSPEKKLALTNLNSLEDLSALTEEDLISLPAETLAVIAWRLTWLKEARAKQMMPPGNWSTWLVLAGRGWGKAASNQTLIATPDGWSLLGNLREGDTIFDENGKPTTILRVFEMPRPEKAYRLHFSDGTHIDACGEHQWVTWTHRDRKQYQRGLKKNSHKDFPADWATFSAPLLNSHHQTIGRYGPEIRTTQEIVDTFYVGSRKDTNHCIPLAKPLDLPEARLPVPPYLMGYWIGNGSSCGGEIHTGSKDGETDIAYVLSRIQAGWPESYIAREEPTKGIIYAKGLRKILRENGLLQNKHIPTKYLRASIGQRRELLEGLMDSDGHASAESGHCEFCTVHPHIADQVQELLRSLGEKPVISAGEAKLNGRVMGMKYRVKWRPLRNPFSLPRKQRNVRELGSQSLRNHHRMIVRYMEIEPVPMRCLTVDSPNSMFLAGEGMIPTHNTRVGAEAVAWYAYSHPNSRCHVLCPTNGDVRDVAFEGESGILSCLPPEVIASTNRSLNEIVLKNGSRIKGFSAEEPERMRGPQCHFSLLDEAAAYNPATAQMAIDMLKFGLRLGDNPQMMITTTPKPVPWIKNVLDRAKTDEKIIITTGSTYENKDNLAASFFQEIAQYEGTQLGRQEIYAELIDGEEGGILKRDWFKLWPNEKPFPRFEFVLQTYDTAFTAKDSNDPTASTTWGIFEWKPGIYAALLCDCWAEHLEYPTLKKRALEEYQVPFGEPGKKPDLVLIEAKANGISLAQDLSYAGVNARTYNPGRLNKVTRLHMVSDLVMHGRVFLPESQITPGRHRDWCEPFIAEVCSLRNDGTSGTGHDDYTDNLSMALSFLRDQQFIYSYEREDEPEYYHRESERVNPYAV